MQWPQRIEVTAENRPHRINELFNSRVDWEQNPPFLAYLISNTDGDDAALFRWPHFFADARGGVTLIEELARLYDERIEPRAVESADDEIRQDVGMFGKAENARAADVPTEGPRYAWWIRKLWNVTARSEGPNRDAARRVVRLATGAPAIRESMRLDVRRFTESQTEDVLAAAMRVCGFARLADFVRACAIRALHEQVGGPGPDACYSTMHLIEGRKRRDPGPVCHNLFAAIPVLVPAAIAGDRRAVADHIQAVAVATAGSRRAYIRWRKLAWLARVPALILARLFAANLRGGGGWLPLGLTTAPSMPLGFMGPLTKTRSEFCGAKLKNIFGVRPASFQAGFAINVNYAQGRMNIATSYFEPRVSREQIGRLIDRFAELLRTPDQD